MQPGWEHADAPRLWRFHLHYWDWAWGLAADPDRLAARALFARLWRSWQASAAASAAAMPGTPTRPRCAPGRGAACTATSSAGSDIEPDFVAGLAAHAGFLRRHLEYDVGGNHLIKDLKALAGLAVFFADERLLRLALRRLTRQLARQVLADGGHYERAPAYHCQVLADLIDVADLLPAAGRAPAGETDRGRRPHAALAGRGAHPRRPGTAAQRRLPGRPRAPRRAAARTRHPDEPAARAARHRAGTCRGRRLAPARRRRPAVPAVAARPRACRHASAAWCTWTGVPLLIDTGTSTYEPGPVRRYERSTAAHSTVQVDGADSTEVWGVFRAGRRARVSGLAVQR